MKTHTLRRTRGVSLIEALIAMAVMSFGMLSLVGVQSTLRFNADVARQRAEATRIAEQEIERARSFSTVGTAATDGTDFDGLTTGAPKTINLGEANAEFTVTRDVVNGTDGLQRAVNVTVSWIDRSGTTRNVILRDVVTRAEPALSGLLSSIRTLTAPGKRENRHPTIPPRAHDLGDGSSIFKPNEGGTAAWVFDNLTGQITYTCVVAEDSTSQTLTIAGCTKLSAGAQLLSGAVRFNLRGASVSIAGVGNVFKPIPNGTVAWVIDNAQSAIVSRCTVPYNVSTAALTAGDLGSCTAVNPAQAISPFGTADAGYSLVASDSEDPRWPALNLDVSLTLSSTGHGNPSNQCYTDAPTTAAGANARTVVEYFCIIYPNSTRSWAGSTALVPKEFADANPVGFTPPTWSIAASADAYRVCRYTKASTDFTDNANHPKTYAKWKASCDQPGDDLCRPVIGNLINQNFLVIAGTKSCPTDVASNPATGDMVNSNTLQHQP